MGFFGGNKKEEKVEEPDPREVVKQQLQFVSDNALIERQEQIGALFQDPYSIVCFVNDDMPFGRQLMHVTEAVSDYTLHFSNANDVQNWFQRQKLTNKKDKLVCFRLPAEDMSDLYSTHLNHHRIGKPTPFKTISTIIFNGVAYPVAFCLGVYQAALIPQEYYVYEHYTM